MNLTMRDDRGAVMAIGAAAMTVILLVAALVVDLGATRATRASDQVATDAASTAGVVALVDGDGQEACASALDYLEIHVGAVAGISCNSFPALCDDATSAVRAVGTVGEKTVTIVHPVPNDDPTMVPSGVGASAQPATAIDGNPCDRVGVAISSRTKTFFSSIAGGNDGSTVVHSVARVSDEYGRNLIINLLLLEPHECEVLTVGGGGSSGGISVAAVTDPATGDVYPGRISLDSDGTVNCASRGTIHANGSGATIRADGPPGCGINVLGLVAGLGYGCGIIETYAPGAPGCNLPACTSGGIIAPGPTKSQRPLTRAPIDWTYNCKSSYPVTYNIRGCSDSGSKSGYIDDLVLAVNAYAPFQSYRDAGYPCQINGGPGTTVVVPQGNWLIDCVELKVQRALIFEGGNLVVEGDITLGASGSLRVNTNNTGIYSWSPGSSVPTTQNSPNAAWVYMQDGIISKSGSGSLELVNTMVYMSATSGLSLSGGAGAMLWSAPRIGPFEDLALWSESALDHNFSGSAGLELEGIFFLPNATMIYTGNGGQASVAAQFIADKASVQGNGSIEIAPKYDRAIKHPPPAISELIR